MLLSIALLAGAAAALPAQNVSLSEHTLARRAVAAASWANIGCVSDGVTRVLATKVYSGNLNSQDYCVDKCNSAGYKYAGVQYGGECWCGNALGSNKLLPPASCAMPCAGNNKQTCGAAYVLNLFANPSTLKSDGCYQDFNTRVLPKQLPSSWSMTPLFCVNQCAAAGYAFAGVEYGTQCWCGDSKPTSKIGDDKCSSVCPGDNKQKCGGGYALNLYSLGTAAGGGGGDGGPTAEGLAPASSNAATKAYTGTTNGPSGGTKYLWAHHMVGDTYSYTNADWTVDINGAKAAGMDGFALNMGRDSWQPARVAAAYTLAQALGNFKLFFSFDMSSFSCSSAADAQVLATLVKTYAAHPAQAKYANKVLVSTFAGQNCDFGQGSTEKGWNYMRALVGVPTYFMPAVFQDVSTFKAATWFDGVFNWNSGWPMDNNDITTASDATYLSALGNKGYMAAVSPWFFTYYGPSTYNKNWIYRSDDWLLAERFEQLVANRNKYDMAELISWNDFGESHYVGQLARPSDQPMSTGWTDNMPHTGLISLINVYAKAFKTGSYGAFGDKLWLWSRPHFRAATATNPTNARPNHWEWSEDNLYVIVTLASPATVKIESGANYATWSLPAGLSKLAVASNTGAIKASIIRGSQTVKSYDSTGKFSYTNAPKDYNFNYFVAEA